jgi:nicotinamidase-related amidase
MLTATLRTRDANNQPNERPISFDPARVAIIVMDMWNSHWDPIYTARSDAIVPGMNQFLHNARAAGATIVLSPTALIDHPGNTVYRDMRQRARAVALPDVPIPPALGFEPAEPQLWLYSDIGMAGNPAPECRNNWGNDEWPLSAQSPGLDIEESDYLLGDNPRGVQEMWNVMHRHRIEHVLYLGGALNMCLYKKPIGVYYLKQHGISTILVRELVEGWSVPRHWYRHDEPFPTEAGEFSCDKADDMMRQWYERNTAPTTGSNIFPQGRSVRPLRLTNATAAYAAKGSAARDTIDGSPLKKHGWSNEGNPAKHNELIVEVAAGKDNRPGDELVFVLDFFAHVKQPGLGHFRLSAATGKMKNGTPEGGWVVLQPSAARTLSSATQIKITPGFGLLVESVSAPDFDRYVVQAPNPLGAAVTAFRLEALAHPSLPAGGPGLGSNGSFFLNQFMVRSIGDEG